MFWEDASVMWDDIGRSWNWKEREREREDKKREERYHIRRSEEACRMWKGYISRVVLFVDCSEKWELCVFLVCPTPFLDDGDGTLKQLQLLVREKRAITEDVLQMMSVCLVIGESEVYHFVPVHSPLQNIGSCADCIQNQFQCKPSKHTLYKASHTYTHTPCLILLFQCHIPSPKAW